MLAKDKIKINKLAEQLALNSVSQQLGVILPAKVTFCPAAKLLPNNVSRLPGSTTLGDTLVIRGAAKQSWTC